MPNIKSAKKRVKTSEARKTRNYAIRSLVKNAVKKFEASLTSENVADRVAALGNISATLDKAAKKGIIHKNTAARKKSRLAKRLNKMA